MSEFKNSDVIRHILKAILVVAGRRTLDSFAVKVVKTVVKTLDREFDFLKYVAIKNAVYSEVEEIVTVSSDLDSIDPSKIGKAIDILLREVYIELKDEAGLYFISELKEYIGEKYVLAIKNLGVDLDVIQSEQHQIYSLQDRKKSGPTIETETEQNVEKIDDANLLDYNWNDVSKWEYDNNVVSLYDNEGDLLDKLHLDMLIEDYVNRYTKDKESIPMSKMFEIDEKEHEFLQMLHSRDMNIELAKVLLHISREKLDNMVQKLLELEMLQHVSFNEVKLTEKGINYLMGKGLES
ncbi:MAG: hypothetical protein JSW06_00255 [Thermoplasmatales archaeon]|nr:MAG: hypothetical protein JSW06_00255 [Thermoplasmatales archaeon]